MSRQVQSQPRCIAVLKLPKKQVPRLIIHARHIVRSMTQSPWFPSPRPSLATTEKATEALAAAQAATLGGGVAQTAARDDEERALRLLLEQLGRYVQSVADAHVEHAREIIESAGMYVKGQRTGGRPGFRLRDGRVSGEIEARCDQAGNRASYEWEISLDERVTWARSRITTEARVLIPALRPGARVWVRYRSIVKNAPSDWSEPQATIVT
jgi:hypothetical protein